jgi:citrate lyase gamma subunit
LSKGDSATEVIEIDYEKIGGSDEKKIALSLKNIRTNIRTNPITHLGIILDIDSYSSLQRIEQVNTAIINSLYEYNIEPFTNERREIQINVSEKRSIAFSTLFIKEKTGKGNLESLFQEIVTTAPVAANCLTQWKTCCNENGVKIKESDFMKFWREVYIRYDYCKDKELNKHAADNCTFEKALDNMLIEGKPKAWDYEAEVLQELKSYLSKFI